MGTYLFHRRIARRVITIFIDESGDLGFTDKGSGYFIIALLATSNPEHVQRTIRRVRDTIKSRRKPAELHWHSSSDLVRSRLLRRLAMLDIELHLLILDKKSVSEYLHEKKDRLYHYLAGLIIDQASFSDRDVLIIFDKRSKNRLVREDLSMYILNKIAERDGRVTARIRHERSTDERGLQAADMIAGAAFRKYQHGDELLLAIISKRIVTEKKIFSRKNE